VEEAAARKLHAARASNDATMWPWPGRLEEASGDVKFDDRKVTIGWMKVRFIDSTFGIDKRVLSGHANDAVTRKHFYVISAKLASEAHFTGLGLNVRLFALSNSEALTMIVFVSAG
jgi:hypothetical protein